MGNVDYAGNLDLSDLKYVDLSAAEIARFRLEKGDLLFNRTNSKDLVGKTGLWDIDLDAIAASYFIRLRVNKQRVRPHYVWAFMNTTYMKRVLFETARGAIGQANINTRELRAFPVPVPDLYLQKRFESRCRESESIRVLQATATASSETAFDALLSGAFSEHRRKSASLFEVKAAVA